MGRSLIYKLSLGLLSNANSGRSISGLNSQKQGKVVFQNCSKNPNANKQKFVASYYLLTVVITTYLCKYLFYIQKFITSLELPDKNLLFCVICNEIN